MGEPDLNLLHRLVGNLAAAGAAGREVVDSGPFRAFLSPDTDYHLMSFATPCGVAPVDWHAAIVHLKAVFAQHARTLRLEFFEELYPTLIPALAEAGIGRTKSADVRTLAHDEMHPHLKISGGEYRRLDALDAGLLKGFLAAQQRGYSMPAEDALHWLPALEAGLEDGSVMAAATVAGDGPVCGATLMLGGGAAELAGVWTLPERRGRGLACDLCSRLLNDYFETGADLCWLSTDDPTGGMYERLGFRPVGTQLNYG